MRNLLLVLCCFFTLSCIYSQGSTNIWIGGVGNWHVASNWDLGVVPSSSMRAIIRGNGAHCTINDLVANPRSVIVESGTNSPYLAPKGSLLLIITLQQTVLRCNQMLHLPSKMAPSWISVNHVNRWEMKVFRCLKGGQK